jgi:hypothetical protein
MSESREDEVDDGDGEWEEEADATIDEFGGHIGRSSSPGMRGASSKRAATQSRLTLSPSRSSAISRQPSSHSYSNRTSPRTNQFEFGASSSPMAIPSSNSQTNISGQGGYSSMSLPSSYREDPSAWQSNEMREMMERARANAQARR